MRTYEGMFLLDSGQAVKDWDATVGVVIGVLERYCTELALNVKWEDRKLSYPIKKQKRGTYYLAYFKAPTEAIAQVRADLLLREEVLRFLILARPEDLPIPETLEVTTMIDDEDDDRRGGGRRRRDDRGSRRSGGGRDDSGDDDDNDGDDGDDGDDDGGED